MDTYSESYFSYLLLREHVDSAGHSEKDNFFVHYSPAESLALRGPAVSHSTALFIQ